MQALKLIFSVLDTKLNFNPSKDLNILMRDYFLCQKKQIAHPQKNIICAIVMNCAILDIFLLMKRQAIYTYKEDTKNEHY